MIKIMPCNCVSVLFFEVKSGGTKRNSGVRPKINVPWTTQQAGAKYQDEKFGLGLRAHNVGGKGANRTATCTVCGKPNLL